MERIHLTILLILLVQFDRSFARIIFKYDDDLYEGSQCTVDNKKGVCTKIYKCPEVLLKLSQNKRPSKSCGFNGTIPIICCLKNPTHATSNNVEQSLNTEEITTSIVPLIELHDGFKSMMKCTNYYYRLCNVFESESRKIDDTTEERSKDDKILGGTRAKPKEFRGAAAVGCRTTNNSWKWFCGGTLISEHFVLTAAHCLYNRDCGPATWVRLGVINLVKENSKVNRPMDYKIIERLRHPKYIKYSLYHDIALLRLDHSVEFNDFIRPACLISLKKLDLSLQAFAFGWGKTNFDDDVASNDLLKVEMPLRPHEICNKYYINDPQLKMGIVNNWQICAGNEGKDTCQGDSGGGLMLGNDECLQGVVGITSFGKSCGTAVPGIYTRVSNYIDWIENIVWPD